VVCYSDNLQSWERTKQLLNGSCWRSAAVDSNS
jgi:hypothetical protein